MSKISAGLVALMLVIACSVIARADSEKITQDELVRRTQELADSIAVGNQAPWRQYFAEDAMYFDERGRNMDKETLVADITPLPKGYSGCIKLVKPQSRIVGQTAIL